MNGSAPHAIQSSFTRDILFVIFKRKLFLIALFVIGVAIVGHGVTTSVAEYEARARVLVKRTRQGYEMPTETQAVLRRGEVINTELQIIMSAAVAEVVVDKLGLAEGVDRGWMIASMENRIRARALPESDIIDITFRHTNPDMAAEVVNATLDAYLEIRKGVALSAQAVRFLDEQVGAARAARDSIAGELAKLGAQEGMHARGLAAEMQMSHVDRFRTMLENVTADIDKRGRQIAVVEEWLVSGRSIMDVKPGAIYDSEGIRRTHTALADLGIELADTRARYQPDHPEVLKLEREIAATEAILHQEIEESMESQKLRLEELKAEKRAIEDMMADLRAADERIADTQLRMRLLEHDLGVRIDLYEIIVSRQELFRITAATDPDLLNVAVVSRASVPVAPKGRPVNMRVVVGVFTIVFGILFVFALEKMDQSLERREDIQRYLGVKVLASIPDRRSHRRGR